MQGVAHPSATWTLRRPSMSAGTFKKPWFILLSQEHLIVHDLATFFDITYVFCAKKRVGHACIHPRITQWLASSEVIAPPNSWFFRGKKNKKNPTENSNSNCCFCIRFLLIKKLICFFFGCFCRIFCHINLDCRDQRAILL